VSWYHRSPERFGSYPVFLGKEFMLPANYIIAAGIGVLIHLLQGASILSSPVPYIVPIFVQALSKAYVKYQNRFSQMLLSLPARRNDPAFVMDRQGRVLLSTGRTKEEFEKRGITHIEQIIDFEAHSRINKTTQTRVSRNIEVESYSPIFDRWYKVKVGQNPKDECLLVWFEDITQRHELDNKLAKIREFSNQIMIELPSLIEQDTSFQKLAGLILELGYAAVFIAKFSDDESLMGNVYKLQDGELVSSEKVVVFPDSEAPIWLSRREGRITYAEKSVEQRDVEFQQQYPFDPQVANFIGAPILNFINYHEAEVSIIAFNLDRSIGSGDVLAMEVLANSARSVSSLIGLANQNERKFMQSVTGLCAAAEYSDEITGEHILRVNHYSELLAKELGLTPQEQHQIGQVAAMHDIGKVAIPHLIKLQRTFTPEERREMQMHTIFGAQIIERMMGCCSEPEPRLSMAFEIALYHHQQWNGAGYPDIIQSDGSLAELSSKETEYYAAFRPARGEEIPLVARIVSLADNYDALRSRRQYKPAKDHAETTALIRTDDRSGTAGAERFGPDVMEAFERVHPEFDVIYRNMSG